MKNRVVILPDKRYAFYVNESPTCRFLIFINKRFWIGVRKREDIQENCRGVNDCAIDRKRGRHAGLC